MIPAVKKIVKTAMRRGCFSLQNQDDESRKFFSKFCGELSARSFALSQKKSCEYKCINKNGF
jgi:hypothetical protein